MTQLKDVPEDEVPQEIENFILAGCTNITLKKQPNGKWAITGE